MDKQEKKIIGEINWTCVCNMSLDEALKYDSSEPCR